MSDRRAAAETHVASTISAAANWLTGRVLRERADVGTAVPSDGSCNAALSLRPVDSPTVSAPESRALTRHSQRHGDRILGCGKNPEGAPP